MDTLYTLHTRRSYRMLEIRTVSWIHYPQKKKEKEKRRKQQQLVPRRSSYKQMNMYMNYAMINN